MTTDPKTQAQRDREQPSEGRPAGGTKHGENRARPAGGGPRQQKPDESVRKVAEGDTDGNTPMDPQDEAFIDQAK